jgi:hypothetical protein
MRKKKQEGEKLLSNHRIVYHEGITNFDKKGEKSEERTCRSKKKMLTIVGKSESIYRTQKEGDQVENFLNIILMV